jgi:hypothetical protein
MKHLLVSLLLLASAVPAFASFKNSVESQGDWIIVTTISKFGKELPTLWALRKDQIQSIEFSDIDEQIVRLRITTTELIVTDSGVQNKQYESLWIDSSQAESLMRNIVAAITRKAEQASSD